MAKVENFTLIVPAAGTGNRFGSSCPKQYNDLCGRSVLRRSVDVFDTFPGCAGIYVAHGPDDAKSCHEMLSGLQCIHFVPGGDTRKNSIFNVLNLLSHLEDDDIILIHDAARPCLRRGDVQRLLGALADHRAASLALPVTSTLRRGGSGDTAGDLVARDGLWAMQTPQAFRYGDLMRAYGEADPDKNYTDDTQLVSALGIAVKLVKGSPENIKITVPEDMAMAEKILAASRESRTGLGFDVHAFDPGKAGPVRLCGVDVPYECALKGHSDADVGLHALTDALYGALGAGDIGRHFPPSDAAFLGMDSAVFLQHAMEMLAGRGGRLVHADLTLICERPKIAPHAEEMRARVAGICGVEKSRISVKATTTEGLGFTGRSEGIAAQAVVSVSCPEGACDE